MLDLGLGSEPWTTCELAEALATLSPTPSVLGVDNDPDRVTFAQRHAAPGLSFALGGFDQPPQRARVIRAMNLLRQYSPEQVPALHAQLGEAVTPGGLLIEGTSNKDGSILSAWWLRRGADGLKAEGLLVATDGEVGFAPWMFARWLPRSLRPKGKPNAEARALLERWKAAWTEIEGDPLERMAASALAIGGELLTPRAALLPPP